ncbi:MAG: hypothetical protein L3K17_06020 [Thermoplasmata archaeon]|nr:hypothetical protein [Thermoplasmata archaeon]
MPSLGVARSHWPVVGWLRLRLPPQPAPVLLMGSAPPPMPPLDVLEPNPVTTDPRKRIFAFEQAQPEGWVLRLIWDADDPLILEAEYRAPFYDRRLPRSSVPVFWAAVKQQTAPLGALPVEAADPRP